LAAGLPSHRRSLPRARRARHANLPMSRQRSGATIQRIEVARRGRFALAS
jgi:hypothetical protein